MGQDPQIAATYLAVRRVGGLAHLQLRLEREFLFRDSCGLFFKGLYPLALLIPLLLQLFDLI